jgi:hypothetical protein
LLRKGRRLEAAPGFCRGLLTVAQRRLNFFR